MKRSGARSGYGLLAHCALLGGALRGGALLGAWLAVLGCSDPDLDRARAEEPEISDAGPEAPPLIFDGGPCGFPGIEGWDEGCPCSPDGEEHDCRRYYRLESADYTSCLIGTQTCTDGEWGGCAGTRTIVVPPDELPPGVTVGDTAPQ